MVRPLQSIQPITRIISTNGSRPVEVLCNDSNYYICKYARFTPASRLFNEYIATCFLKIWNISTPDIAFINIEPAHVIEGLPAFAFNKPCFGSKVVRDAQDVNRFTDATQLNHLQFLEIALFDIWLSNEDRNHNNFNLLISNESENNYQFYAIDHEYCFNTDTLERELNIISFDETIINTDLCKSLLEGIDITQWLLFYVEDFFYKNVELCIKELDAILTQIPVAWGIDINLKKEHLTQKIFAEDWLKSSITAFKSYLQLLSSYK